MDSFTRFRRHSFCHRIIKYNSNTLLEYITSWHHRFSLFSSSLYTRPAAGCSLARARKVSAWEDQLMLEIWGSLYLNMCLHFLLSLKKPFQSILWSGNTCGNLIRLQFMLCVYNKTINHANNSTPVVYSVFSWILLWLNVASKAIKVTFK